MSFLVKAAGFLLAPTAGAIGSVALVRALNVQSDRDKCLVAAGAHAASALALYAVSSGKLLPGRSSGEKDFARGGMWGEILSAAFLATAGEKALASARDLPAGGSSPPKLGAVTAWLTSLQLPSGSPTTAGESEYWLNAHGMKG